MASRIITAPVTLQGLDASYRTAIRGFEKVALNSAKRIMDYVPMIYTEGTFSPRTITYPVYAGIPDAVTWDGESEITAQGLSYLYDVTATQYLYANSTEFTFLTDLFDLYGINGRKSRELGKSLQIKRQKVAAALLNNAFTTNWVDGVPLIASNHPQAPNTPGDSTQSNLVSGAFTRDTFLDALVKGSTMRDPMGRPITQRATKLLVHDTKVADARKVLNWASQYAGGTANNDENPFKHFAIAEPTPYPYFTTTTMWIVLFEGDEPQLKYSEKVPIKLWPPKETNSHGVKLDGMFAEAYWAEGYTSIVGSTGA